MKMKLKMKMEMEMEWLKTDGRTKIGNGAGAARSLRLYGLTRACAEVTKRHSALSLALDPLFLNLTPTDCYSFHNKI